MDVTVNIPDNVFINALNDKLRAYEPVDPFPEVMDKQTASKFMHCSRNTLDTWIKDNRLPVAKIGNSYRFIKSDLVNWLKSQNN